MAVTEQEKVRARHHMGYLGVGSASTFSLGIPAGVQTQFVIEAAWSKILPAAENLFRDLLDRLDVLEAQIVDNSENVEVEKIDEIEINPEAFKHTLQRYLHWQGSLGNLLGVPPNPFDQRPFLGSGYNGGGGINALVNH